MLTELDAGPYSIEAFRWAARELRHAPVMSRSPPVIPSWEDVAADFQPDGALRDIYVLNANLDDWRAVLEHLGSGPYGARLDDAPPGPLPDAAELFGEARRVLRFSVAGMEVCCHFFLVEELEFDLEPREVTRENYPHLLDLMRTLVRVTGKPAILTYENMQRGVIIRVE